MTALWTDTVLVEAGVVGFGGRIMFYGRGDEDPIVVEGELTVFAYDDTGDVSDEAVPARKYVFRAEELSKHYSESKLGHSYSFWVPWGRVGGPQRQVSLIARFKSAKGGVVMSEMTRHLLPGAQPSVAASELPAQPAVQGLPSTASAVSQASHHGRLPAGNPTVSRVSGGMQTTTISLSDALAPAAGHEVLGEVAAGVVPTPGTQMPTIPAAGPVANGGASSTEPNEIRALVREAVQDALAANQGEQSVDRFGRRKYRARIAPKLPPTRDPAPTPLRPATPRSALGSTTAGAVPIGSANVTSAVPTQTQPPSSWAR
ncbi:MAG: hypothetical protein WD845_12855 [Pirellulales bacterium]